MTGGAGARAALPIALVLIAWLAPAPAAWAAGAQVQPMPSANPLSGDPAAIEQGHGLYLKWCAQCHGPKADGVSERWGKYAGDLRIFWRGFYEFVGIVVEGRPDKQMPPWGEVLGAEQIATIGAYLETLAIEGANWQ